jgi:hypothetical protein
MELTRRDALTAVGFTAVSATLAAREAAAQQMAGALPIRKPTKNRITQSVCQWCYRQMALPDFFKGVVDRGLTHVDLLNEEQWTQAKNDFGLGCSMAYVGAGGINDIGVIQAQHGEAEPVQPPRQRRARAAAQRDGDERLDHADFRFTR